MTDDWHCNKMYANLCLNPDNLVSTDLDPDAFVKCFGQPNTGWTSATFGFMGREWAWQFKDTISVVKAAIVRDKLVFAFSSEDSFYKFLAFVASKLG